MTTAIIVISNTDFDGVIIITLYNSIKIEHKFDTTNPKCIRFDHPDGIHIHDILVKSNNKAFRPYKLIFTNIHHTIIVTTGSTGIFCLL